MAGEEREPVVRRPFRILAGGIGAVCFILAAWFALGPDWRDAGLVPYMFLACGVVMAGLALTGSALWRGRPRDRGGPA
jgi:hypothetical protein